MTRKSRFNAACLVAGILADASNAIPYLLTRGAYQHDGQEVAGFPFVFRRVGGDCWPTACDTYPFHLGYFVADLALAVAFALVVGAIATRVGRTAPRPPWNASAYAPAKHFIRGISMHVSDATGTPFDDAVALYCAHFAGTTRAVVHV